MKIVSYNIHYAIGKDERYDLERVVNAVEGADIIALQEVERHYDTPKPVTTGRHCRTAA
jgi:endonuclease/exonuclease/phosphatase family metal-dependent hydrolase